MLISNKQYQALRREHISFLLLKNDDRKAVDFVQQLLAMELAATKQANPDDTATTDKLSNAIQVLKNIQCDLMTNTFGANSQ